jgi:coenzyme F420 hydrogenase subunit beta
MLVTAAAFPLPLVAALATLALLLVAGQLHAALSTRAKLRAQAQEIEELRRELQEQTAALEEAQREAWHLHQGPRAELLSMLQLAHELRSPLASIQSALDMLLQGYARNNVELQDEMLNLSRERAATMLDQVNDFLRLGAVRHSEMGRPPEDVQLLDVLRRLVPEKRVRARWRAVDFNTDVPDSLPVVKGTYDDMEHLLSNLINNAIKYTNPGGKVTVCLKEDGHSVVGVVKDTGIGIAPEDISKIFDEFYRSEAAKDMDAHGTGLGLSIAKRVVDLYGGQLCVESEVGHGSQFSFVFPIVRKEEELAATQEQAPGPEAVQQVSRRSRHMDQQEIKVFRDLQKEVILRGLCGKCGGCVSFCSAGKLNALQMGEDDLPRYADEEKCLHCGICYMICPSTNELDAEVRHTFGWRPPIGIYEAARSARTTDEAVHQVATDGGVVTALLLYMLDRHLIDGAIVSRKTSVFGREPLIASTREELIAAAGSHFGGSAHLEELGDQYTTYSPTISAVKGLESKHLHRTAVVGTPCQIRSIRKMQCLGILPAHIINYSVGLFCMENFFFNAATRKELETKLGVDLSDIDKLNIKEDVIITLRDGATIHVPFDEVDAIARPACLACTDFANDYADLSAGGLGSPAGYTTVLLRTEKGNRIYSEALAQGYISERKVENLVEGRNEEARMISKIVAFAQQKQVRGEARLIALAREGGNSGK